MAHKAGCTVPLWRETASPIPQHPGNVRRRAAGAPSRAVPTQAQKWLWQEHRAVRGTLPESASKSPTRDDFTRQLPSAFSTQMHVVRSAPQTPRPKAGAPQAHPASVGWPPQRPLIYNRPDRGICTAQGQYKATRRGPHCSISTEELTNS